MPDLTTSFERFKDELSRQRQEYFQHYEKMEKLNKELNRTFDGKISDLIHLQEESLRSQKEQAALQKIKNKEEDIESGRASKSRESTADDIEETKDHSKDIAGGIKSIAASFRNPKILIGMLALAIADSFTKINLTNTIVAADTARHMVGASKAITAASKVKGAKVTPAATRPLGPPPPGRAEAIRQAKAARRAATQANINRGIVQPRAASTPLTGRVTGSSKLVPITEAVRARQAAAAAKPNVIVRAAGSVGRGVAALPGASATGGGIMKILGGIGKVLGPLVKMLGKIAWPLAILLSVVDGFIAAFGAYEEGGGISEILSAFLMGALESFVIGFLDGFATIVSWLADFFDDLPYYIGEIIDGVLDFVGDFFGGDFLLNLVYAFGNLGAELMNLIWALIKLIWEIPKVIFQKIWGWIEALASSAWDWIKLKMGFISQEEYDERLAAKEKASMVAEKKKQDERERELMEREEKRTQRKRRNMTAEDRREFDKKRGQQMQAEKEKKAAEKAAAAGEDAAEASEDAAKSTAEAAESTEKAAEDMKKSVGDLSAMEDELIPQSMLEKSAEFAKGIMGAMGNSVKTVGNLVQGKGIGDMLGGMNQASARGAARSYGFKGSGSVFGRGGHGGVFGSGYENPNAQPPLGPLGLPGGPGGMPSSLPGGGFGPTPGTDGSGRHLMDQSGSNSMMPPSVIMPVNNTTSNQVVHNTSSTTTLASGNIINEDRSIMMSRLQDNIHDSLV